ncbi:MAG TPA: hypothetical protein VFN31_03210 [Candidatus Saccharimonadales bacterium]|nr:hypothetical protein [Candidatus Saccharimonadales bacterium]
MPIRSLTKHKLAQSVLALFLIDFLFFGSINSTKVAPFMLIVGLIVLVMNIYFLVYGVISLIRLYGIAVKRKGRISLYSSIFLGILIALQSIGELSGRDLIVIVMLAVASYAYITYAGTAKQKEQKL